MTIHLPSGIWFTEVQEGDYLQFAATTQKYHPQYALSRRRWRAVVKVERDDSYMTGVAFSVKDDNQNLLTLDASWFLPQIQKRYVIDTIDVEKIEKFLGEGKAGIPKSSWFSGDGYSLYLRVSYHDVIKPSKVFEIANWLDHHNGDSGVFRAFLGYIEYLAREHEATVYVENIFNHKLIDILIRYGYHSIKTPFNPVSCYIDPGVSHSPAYYDYINTGSPCRVK